MLSQTNCTAQTAMGANLVSEIGVAGGGATFRAFGPQATAVYVNGVFGGVAMSGKDPSLQMAKDAHGYWSGFLPQAGEGDTYGFYVVGVGSEGPKRDPWARELACDPALPFPVCPAVIRAASAYPWHDAGFPAPDFSGMVVYQLHIGTYVSQITGTGSTFLDVIDKIPYLVALGVNVVQPLPVSGNEDLGGSLGYDGSDYFSPELGYVVTDPGLLAAHLATINGLLAAKGHTPIAAADLAPGYAQLKAMVDLLHVYKIAVAFDVVYNHAGGWDKQYPVPVAVDPTGLLHGDDRSIYFWDRAKGDANASLYLSDQGYVGGLSFALWNADIRAFLQHNALFYLGELHGDGFRYDEIAQLLKMNGQGGWDFVRPLTDAVRATNPRALQNAEYWPGEYEQPASLAVKPTAQGGMGFDAVQHDSLRIALRGAVQSAAGGAGAAVSMTAIQQAMWPAGFDATWRAIPCVENHDIVKAQTDLRVAKLADSSNSRSWYGRSRSRVATGLLLTAPGIPQIFMGQEFLEDKQWDAVPGNVSTLIWWGGLAANPSGVGAVDGAMADHLRFTQDAVALRLRLPGLRGEGLNVFYASDSDRVIAFQRWVVGAGEDVVVVATLSETTWFGYPVGFPSAGLWREVFNSDVYDSCNANGVMVNPRVAGNSGGVTADGPPMNGLPVSASVVIPANGVVVFVKG